MVNGEFVIGNISFEENSFGSPDKYKKRWQEY
jgi:hypothetical protein